MFVRLPRRRRRRVPDLFFISKVNLARIRPTFINGPPDLTIEIVSPDSQNRDRREKYLEYEASGVREYWIIDPLSKTLDVYDCAGIRETSIIHLLWLNMPPQPLPSALQPQRGLFSEQINPRGSRDDER